MRPMATTLHLAVRLVHVLAMAVLLGGSLAAWVLARNRGALTWFTHYEWAFWVGLAVLAATGVGNLGAIGAPGPKTAWGRTFTWKLGAVTVLVLGSIVRSLGVLRIHAFEGRNSRYYNFLQRSYILTTALLTAIVVLAEVLAHG
jgi:uncharacterized membrane protein